jgi:hypothetical protein
MRALKFPSSQLDGKRPAGQLKPEEMSSAPGMGIALRIIAKPLTVRSGL